MIRWMRLSRASGLRFLGSIDWRFPKVEYRWCCQESSSLRSIFNGKVNCVRTKSVIASSRYFCKSGLANHSCFRNITNTFSFHLNKPGGTCPCNVEPTLALGQRKGSNQRGAFASEPSQPNWRTCSCLIVSLSSVSFSGEINSAELLISWCFIT